MKPDRRWCMFFIVLLLSFASVLQAEDDDIDKLISQLKGEAQYYDMAGNPLGFFDSWTTRHFEERCKLNAAILLGRKGGHANKAVEVLIEELSSGTNDIDTGDGILPIRSQIALALGRINNPKAIGPLLEKLKLPDTAALLRTSSISANTPKPSDIGHEAIIRALGMFGGQASEAIPILEDIAAKTTSESLKQSIENTLYRIRNDKFIMPEDFY